MTASAGSEGHQWHIITCEYPPSVGGVSDYAFTLASGLGSTSDVHVWCPPGQSAAPAIERVTVHGTPGSFSRRELRRLSTLLDGYAEPRQLFVQWVPQGFGYRSINLGFAIWVAARAWRGRDRVHLMVHEPFLPWSANPFHLAVSLIHRLMLMIASHGATHVWLSTQAWKDRIRRYVPSHIPIEWLPVPAPALPTQKGDSALEPIGAGQMVGHFGTHTPLVTGILGPALDVVLQRTQARVLLVGRDSDTFRRSFIAARPHAAERVEATGVLSPESVALHLRRCDVMIQPYPDGVTTRRTSTLTLLSLGLPVVTNAGHLSEAIWADAGAVALSATPDGTLIGTSAVALLGDPRERTALAARALSTYDERFAPRHAVAMLNAAAWPQHHAA